MPSVSSPRGSRAAPAITVVEPSPRFAARVGAGIFGGEALILLVVALLPSPGGWSELRLASPLVCGVLAVLLLRFADRVGPRMLELAVALGTLLVTLHAWKWGSGLTGSGEMLYVWLALYVAYFLPSRQAAAQLALMAAAYLFVLLLSAPPDAVAASWLIMVGVLFPPAALLRTVRDGVTELLHNLSDAARTDALTGLKNRLALDQELAAEVERALRAGQPLSVVIGDLDHFKSVNDRLGHRAGDEALVRVGAILEQQRRTGDSIARTGGEEFTILLPGSSEHEAYLVAERLRAAVEREFADDPAGLTFSFGVATYPVHGRSADAVVEAADQALYAAKALGRNRCVIFNSEISAIFAPDIGKIGLPDAILQKPGKLATAELAEIRTHPRSGRRYSAAGASRTCARGSSPTTSARTGRAIRGGCPATRFRWRRGSWRWRTPTRR